MARLLSECLAAIALLTWGSVVHAQAADDYPNKSIRLVVPFSPGGGTDVLARLVGDKLAGAVGQPVVIENRPGAGTMLATEMVARAPADGYTVLVVSASHALNPSLYAKVNYDPLRDFQAITLATTFPFVITVHPSTSAQTLDDLIRLAKAQPGKISYASSGIGATNHLAGEMFKRMSGTDLIHVPYKGGGPALTDAIGGQVPILFGTVIETLPHVKAGRLRALAVTSGKRIGLAPDIPTVAEAGVPGYDVTGWYGFVVPAATPAPVVAKLNREITRILRDPAVAKQLQSTGAEPTPSSATQAQAFIAAEAKRWGVLIREAGIKAE